MADSISDRVAPRQVNRLRFLAGIVKDNMYVRVVLALLGLASLESQAQGGAPDLVWAVNVGGPEYIAIDGTKYEAENSIVGGMIGRQDKVLGSQDAFVYQSFREGDIKLARPIANGLYDITFHFSEPDDLQPGNRIFDVYVEGRRIINSLDVMHSRDGKVRSALTFTTPSVKVTDDELNINFDASSGLPLLNALDVRKKVEVKKTRHLVWSDDFDYHGLPDSGNWNIEQWDSKVVNDEDQAYTNRLKNVRVESGYLIIEAHREKYGDAAYTSARIQSRGKGDILYGRVEVRAKLPVGKGTWPAIWMLPSDPFAYATTCDEGDEWQGSRTCDAWPNSGEIDIMEHVGYDLNAVHGTVHTKAYSWLNWEQRKGRILVNGVAEKFHNYVLEWTPDEVRIFVDGSLFFKYLRENTGWESWPFDKPFHLILNLAVGGMWGRAGGGIDDDQFPQHMAVDYVRVYELEATNREQRAQE